MSAPLFDSILGNLEKCITLARSIETHAAQMQEDIRSGAAFGLPADTVKDPVIIGNCKACDCVAELDADGLCPACKSDFQTDETESHNDGRIS